MIIEILKKWWGKLLIWLKIRKPPVVCVEQKVEKVEIKPIEPISRLEPITIRDHVQEEIDKLSDYIKELFKKEEEPKLAITLPWRYRQKMIKSTHWRTRDMTKL